VDEEKVEEVSKFLFLTLVNSGGKSLWNAKKSGLNATNS
jgi:hypothetical protein